MEQIFGYVESVVFSNKENGFTVAKLKEAKKEALTWIVGAIPSVQPGETICCQGVWKNHPQHGIQFEVHSFKLEAPADLIGIQKYLESGMIKGIGPAYAKKIVEKFGLKTLDILEENPEKLAEIEGIGKKKIISIKTCWQEQKQIRDVMIFLQSYGVSPGFAQKIFKFYGQESAEKVQKNPYCLAKDIHGIGFKTADTIAQKLGITQDSPLRIEAGIEHLFWELTNEGHTCYPYEQFIPIAQTALNVSSEQISQSIDRLVQTTSLVKEKGFLWIKPLYLFEISIAKEMKRISENISSLRQVDVDRAIDWAETQLQISLALEQREAVKQALLQKTHVITGGPGTGKSTITKAILTILEKLTPRITLAAPTGRAAKRVSEITNRKAQTIHALLEIDFQKGGFKKNKNNPLETDLIILDEASMIDTQLMYHFLRAVPSKARLIIIGDVDQLPSVGPGTILKDIIKSDLFSVTKLSKIFRQGNGSKIVLNAHRINQGEFPDLRYESKSDFSFIHLENPEEILEKITSLIQTKLPHFFKFHKFDDIQVLSPMKKGLIGTENLNQSLRKALNPRPYALNFMGKSFSIGDKVMQIKNNYQKEVYNGDIGKIIAINEEDQHLSAVFENKVVHYDFIEIDELILAYAVSIHKYQGSECPCVIIPVHISHFKLLNRNLLYTAITRGKKLVIMIGSKKALAIGVRNEDAKKRFTGLVNALLAGKN
ncbi:MAG: ATP-dependent RecD-like DNA helicase [Rhabdochlamydiaceae bacterium]